MTTLDCEHTGGHIVVPPVNVTRRACEMLSLKKEQKSFVARHARAGEYFTVNKIVEREVASHTRARDQNRLFAGFASRVTRHSCELSA